NPRHAFWMVLFLLIPQVVKNHIIHLRQGVAIAVFMLGVSAKPNWLRLGLMSASAFVHSSFFFVLAILAVVRITHEIVSSKELRTLGFLAGAATASMAMGLVASISGARQAELYSDAGTDISGL